MDALRDGLRRNQNGRIAAAGIVLSALGGAGPMKKSDRIAAAALVVPSVVSAA
jgi:hypothetical protein